MTSSRIQALAVVALFALTIIALVLSFSTNPAEANAIPGVVAPIATTSNPTVTNSSALVFATSSCSARIISTSASPIMITFGDVAGNGGPTGSFGHIQAASTTVIYDSGQVGCGALRIYSFTSQVITVSEAR